MDTRQQAACGGKEPLSWAEAERRARTLRRRTGKTIQPFHCKFCNSTHVGNAMGGNVARRKRAAIRAKIERRETWE